MTVSDTTTSITDQGPKPEGFAFPLGRGFQISVPSTWGVTGPTLPTRDLVVMEVSLGMHHLDDINKSDIDLVSPSLNWCPHEYTTARGISISNSVMGLRSHYRQSGVGHARPTNVTKKELT